MDERAICTEQDLDEGETDLRRTVWHTDGVLDTSCHSGLLLSEASSIFRCWVSKT